MTNRFNILTVVLEREIREDDAEHLINAISMLKGVLKVKGNVSSPEDWMAQAKAKNELINKLWKVLNEE